MTTLSFTSTANRLADLGLVRKIYLYVGLVGLLLLTKVTMGQGLKPLARPLEQGHSHNDYWRPQPLFNALEQGFKSVEADVFLVDGALLVGHSRNELQPGQTLENMYLKPLQELVQQNKKLYQQRRTLYLYIDFKTEGQPTYAQLAPLLVKYRHLLVDPRGKNRRGQVKIILTGNYPATIVQADKQRLVFLDGKVEELPHNLNPAVYPVVSGNWAKYFTWTGTGKMPPAESRQLTEWAALARQNGQQIRFWNMPEKSQEQIKTIWQELLKYPSVLIGTDHLDWLTSTLKAQKKQ